MVSNGRFSGRPEGRGGDSADEEIAGLVSAVAVDGDLRDIKGRGDQARISRKEEEGRII
jgi:hypothetical protein